MNTTRKSLINKICAILTILLLTISDFAFVGKAAVNYAIDVVKTNHVNVDFSAYFLNSNGEKVDYLEEEINSGEQYLYVDISVKNEGYFNGKIRLSNNNFNIKSEKLSSEITEITGNEVTLNQINAGSTVTIKLGIEPIQEENISESMLNTTTEVLLEGQYINSKNVETEKYIEINGSANIQVNWKSSEETNAELEAKLLTNSVYERNLELKKVVQILVNSKITANNYPVKNTEVILSVPEEVQEVEVHARSTDATNSNMFFSKENYQYDSQKHQLTIKLANNGTNQISWKKDVQDTFIITYVFDQNATINQNKVTVENIIKTYDEKEVKANQEVMIEDEVNGTISLGIETSEEEIYKGKIYAKEEREYTTTSKINIDYINNIENINIKEGETTYLENGNEITANIIYKQTKINKDEFLKTFGEEGYITVKDSNGAVIANLNKDSETDENGNFSIFYLGEQKSVEFVTSKPIEVGTLNIQNTKDILNAGLEREQISHLTGIKEKQFINNKEESKIISLKETQTDATIGVDVTKFSTVADNQTVTVEATLLADNETKDLYKNPNVTIKFPKEITVVSAQYASLYKNGLEVENTKISKNENGEYEINIKFTGEQEKYDGAGGTKICLKLELNTSKIAPSKTSAIEMTYTNDNKNETKTKNVGIDIESQYGLMIYNQIANYNKAGDSLLTVDQETAYGEINVNSEKKDITLSTALINNYGQNIQNVTLVGRIPSQEGEENFKANLNNIITNREDAKIYYSTDENAGKDDNTWQENIENAASYKIILDEMQTEEVFKFNVEVTLPENLKYNKKGAFSSTATCDYQNHEQQNTSNIILLTKASMTSEEAEIAESQNTENGLETKISAFTGNDSLSNNDQVYEGQTIKYKVTITNHTENDYSNVTVKAKQTNGYVWDLLEKEGYNPYYESNSSEHFYEISNTNELTLGEIKNLKAGESHTYEYESSTYLLDNEKIEGTQTYSTLFITSENKQLDETVTTIKNNIKKSELQVNLFNGSSDEMELPSGGTIKSKLSFKNLTNNTLNNLEIKLAFSSNLHSDVCLTEENEDKVSYQGEEKNEDGTKIITLKVHTIEAGETIEVELYPYTEDDFGEDKSQEIWILAEAITAEKNSYISNKLTRTIYNYTPDIQLSQKGTYEDGKEINIEKDKLNNGDKVKFTATITNREEKEHKIEINYNLDKMIDIESAKILTSNGEEDFLEEISYNNLTKEEQTVKSGEKLTISVIGKIDTSEIESITNHLTVSDEENGRMSDNDLTISVNKLEEYVEPEEPEPEEPEPPENPNNPVTPEEPGNSNNNQSQSEEEKKSYAISGTAWIDKDKDGKRSISEELVKEMIVEVMDTETGIIAASTKTNSNGGYNFNLTEGNYMILFHYNNDLYTTTTYQVSGAKDAENSDAVGREISINGEAVTVGTTDTINLNQNRENIDIGLINRNTFDLKIDKYVSKITVTNHNKTTTYTQKDNTKLAKAEIKSKYLNGSLVVIEYKIKVTNNGDIAGYARNIVDYMPSSLTFNSSLNSDWYLSGENLYNTSLANTKIEAGESKEVTLVLTKNMTESNTGLINNKAEIRESSNLLGIQDETDDKGSADVIINVSTGALVNYVATTMLTLVILIGLAYFVNKKYLSKKI